MKSDGRTSKSVKSVKNVELIDCNQLEADEIRDRNSIKRKSEFIPKKRKR